MSHIEWAHAAKLEIWKNCLRLGRKWDDTRSTEWQYEVKEQTMKRIVDEIDLRICETKSTKYVA